MTADEVLEEFLLDPCCIDCPASDCINERRMADEIVRLRKEFEIATSMLFNQARMINQMQDTLDRLREPSEAVVKAAASTYFTTEALQRAVAAAEQEVANEVR